MGIMVPGVGDVPVVWLPATRPQDYARTRFGLPVVAIVHHRIVGTLQSADLVFAADDTDPATEGSKGRSVSGTFAVGLEDGEVQVHQYVDLSDTHFCNGDYLPGTKWDEWFGAKRVDIGGGVLIWNTNPQTISIEHHDNGGSSDPDKKGIVPEKVIKASIALDRVLLSGDIVAIRNAGIHCREELTARQLAKIVPSKQTLIDHRDIAGSNKPDCWRPWAADEVGFPRQRYVDELTEAPAPTPVYTQAQVDAIVAAATAPLEAEIAELNAKATSATAHLAEAATEVAAAKVALE